MFVDRVDEVEWKDFGFGAAVIFGGFPDDVCWPRSILVWVCVREKEKQIHDVGSSSGFVSILARIEL